MDIRSYGRRCTNQFFNRAFRLFGGHPILLFVVCFGCAWLAFAWIEFVSQNFFDPVPIHRQILGVLCVAVIFLGGFFALDTCRYSVRSSRAPFFLLLVLWVTVVILQSFDTARELYMQALRTLLSNPWPFVLLVMALLFRGQVTQFISRITKAEAAGVKLEVDQIPKIQKTVNPWKRTVTDFGEMMSWVCDLIENTPPDDSVRFLSYTPALGYLTRTEREWERLYRLLTTRPNIQFICLNHQELEKWHATFVGKRTARPEGTIKKGMPERATRISTFILDCQKRVSAEAYKPVERMWSELPGYYIFANRKRALIVTPLFFSINPLKYRSADSNAPIGPTGVEEADPYIPVEMVGFESEDSWTVWMALEACRRYARHGSGKSSAPVNASSDDGAAETNVATATA